MECNQLSLPIAETTYLSTMILGNAETPQGKMFDPLNSRMPRMRLAAVALPADGSRCAECSHASDNFSFGGELNWKDLGRTFMC